MKTLVGLFLALSLAAVASAAPVGPLSTYLVEPCRFLDTRGDPTAHLLDTQSRFYRVHGNCGVPLDAVAVIINVTVTNATGDGHLTLWADNQDRPATSTINFTASGTVANGATVMLAPQDPNYPTLEDLAVYGHVAGSDPAAAIFGSVDLILDVVGFLR
jgi:hypothetical protein